IVCFVLLLLECLRFHAKKSAAAGGRGVLVGSQCRPVSPILTVVPAKARTQSCSLTKDTGYRPGTPLGCPGRPSFSRASRLRSRQRQRCTILLVDAHFPFLDYALR